MGNKFLKWLLVPLDMPRADVANTIMNHLWLQSCETYNDFRRALVDRFGLPAGSEEVSTGTNAQSLDCYDYTALSEEWRDFLSTVERYLDMCHKESEE